MGVKLFVGGLSFNTSTEGLRQAFARFGTVQSAIVMTDRETQRSRGFGFVEMATSEEADAAIAGMNGAMLDGRTIRVDKATPRGTAPPRPAGPRPGGPPTGFRPRPPGGGLGAPRFGAPPPVEESRGGGRKKRGGEERERRPGGPRRGKPTGERRAQDKGRRSEDWW